MATANATCYFPNGSIDSLSQSCNPNAAVSHCCQNTHVCLSNGMCWDTVFNHVIRMTCTDPTWDDPSCPQYCTNDTSSDLGDLRQCDGTDNDWVCGQDVSDCSNSFQVAVGYVDDHRDMSLSAIVALPSVYNAATSTESVIATITVTTRATATSGGFVSASPSSKSNSSTTVGLAAGLGVGVPLLAALLVSLFLLHRAHKEIKALGQRCQSTPSGLQDQSYPTKWQGKHEAASGNIYEAPGSRP